MRPQGHSTMEIADAYPVAGPVDLSQAGLGWVDGCTGQSCRYVWFQTPLLGPCGVREVPLS